MASRSTPLPEPLIERVAQRFKAIGEPMRIRILDRLRDGAASPQELTERLGTSPQNVSKHLGVLQRAGVVRRERQGARVVYEIADPSMIAMCEQVCGSLAREVAELNALIGEEAGR